MSVPAFDAIIHPPTRLQMMAVLVNIDEAEFATLRGMTQVSDSVLSKHLSALVEAGYVKLRKATASGRQRTWAGATRAGRTAFARHVDALRQLAGLADAPAPVSPGSAAASG